jgi:hypothetical protein
LRRQQRQRHSYLRVVERGRSQHATDGNLSIGDVQMSSLL